LDGERFPPFVRCPLIELFTSVFPPVVGKVSVYCVAAEFPGGTTDSADATGGRATKATIAAAPIAILNMVFAIEESNQMDQAHTIQSPSETQPGAWSFVWPWLLGFGLVLYLGLNGGGFDPVVGNQVGIAVWWVLLFAVAVGALPRRRPGTLALCGLGLLGAFALWTALSLRWTESTEKTAADLAAVATLLGVFALATISRGRGTAGQMVNALGTAIAVVAFVGLLSRFHPSWFPDAETTGQFLDTGKERLSYPLGYWNGLAALIGIGLPLVLQIAGNARNAFVQALAGGALPGMLLALFYTLSRGGIAASLIALALFVVLTRDRIAQVPTLLVAAVGGGFLIVLALQRGSLLHGLTDATAASQGNHMLWITIVVCLIAGLAQYGIAGALARGTRREPLVSQRQSLLAVGVTGLVLLVALLAVGAPSRVSNAWDEFRAPSGHSEKGTSRLTSVGGENRYQLWSAAAREFDSEPLTGTGSGTFQLWWTRDGDVGEPIVDTHSLYMQTLGELGILGLLVLLAFIATSLIGGTARVLRTAGSRRPQLAAALAGSTVLWSTSIVDWGWKIPVIPIATLLLIAILLTAGDKGSEEPAPLHPALRGAVAVGSLAALLAIAIPFAGTSLIRQSQSNAREGDVSAALTDARSAQNVQPGAATPRVQQALLYESVGDYPPAEEAARAATEREPTNWKTWLILSRIEAQRGKPEAALRDFRVARSLDPLSDIFATR
jgi:O-antigen ligase